MTDNIVLQTLLPETNSLKLFSRGKVRDVYETQDCLLIVTSDRISAFDVILQDAIPYKGFVLTALSAFWFEIIKDITPTHFITADTRQIISMVPEVKKYESQLAGRTMLVKKIKVYPVECIIRGYLAGSGWKEYKASKTICGISLPAGLTESDKLPEPIFTPSTKATSGHDENISFGRMAEIIGQSDAEELRKRSLAIYKRAHEYALGKGIIICDTKMEWGRNSKDEIVLVDELLTPDSSRFWPQDVYAPGKGQMSFDKQFVRDYLETCDWDKNPPAPKLPDEIIKKTSGKYKEAYKRLTGKALV